MYGSEHIGRSGVILSLIFDRREIRNLGASHQIVFLQLAAQLGAQFLRLFFGVVLDYHFDKQIGSHDRFLSQYTGSVNCAICKTRKARRFCLGVNSEICSICCGTEREQSIDCPLECEYLREAHRHESVPEFDPATAPNGDIRVTEEFLEANQALVILLSSALASGALGAKAVTDFDIREALESLIRAYRALQSGLYYEGLPANPYAAAIHEAVQERVADLRKRETEATGSATTIRDSTVLTVLVFLQRLEFSNNNGRKRSRAFLDFISRFNVPLAPDDDMTDLEPDAPRVIL
jgi:hypothetical protein